MTNWQVKGIKGIGLIGVLAGALVAGGLSGVARAACWQSDPVFDGTVGAMARVGTTLYVGGHFTHVNGIEVNGIAKWDGTSWSALGTGLGDAPYVALLAVDSSGNLYAGGSFGNAGNSYTFNVAKWDGMTWLALGGLIGEVWALVVDSGGNLYAGGKLFWAGNYVAKWDGTSWSAVGTPLGDGTYVLALAVDSRGTVYAGGDLWAGADFLGYLAKWDGTRWSALGTGMQGMVRALAVDSSDNLYMGGDFIFVRKWDGTSWSTLGAGFDDGVKSLALDNSGNLYAGGNFIWTGDGPANRVAKWDGTSWWALDKGLGGDVRALAVDSSGTVYAGGSFLTAGGKPSANFAEFQPPCPACNNVGGARNITIKPKVIVGKINDWFFGNLRIDGEFISATAFDVLNPLENGARVLIKNAAGITKVDVTLASGAFNEPLPYGGKTRRGWTLDAGGTEWTFRDATRSPANEKVKITKMVIQDRSDEAPNQVKVNIIGRRGHYPIVVEDMPIQVTVVLGGQDASLAGQCGETVFAPADCSFNAARDKLTCKQAR